VSACFKSFIDQFVQLSSGLIFGVDRHQHLRGGLRIVTGCKYWGRSSGDIAGRVPGLTFSISMRCILTCVVEGGEVRNVSSCNMAMLASGESNAVDRSEEGRDVWTTPSIVVTGNRAV
jgi:hypothetical protein